MRYLLQIAVMAGDVLVHLACIAVLYHDRSIFSWVFVALALRVWWLTGGPEAWRPSVIRQFMRNAKEMGL